MKTTYFIIFILFFLIILTLCLYANCASKCVLLEENNVSNAKIMVRKK